MEQKHAGRASEAPCAIQEGKCSSEEEPQAVSQLWLLYCGWDAHAPLAGEAASGQGMVSRTLHPLFL